MDINNGGLKHNNAQGIGMSHVHTPGSMHGYDVSKEGGGEIPMLENQMEHMEHSHMTTTFSLTTDSAFLIEGIKISSIQGIILAVIFTFVTTILFECFKFTTHWREIHREKFHGSQAHKKKQKWGLFLSSVSHMVSVCLALIMMLCVMTMNVWLMVSVVLGSGFGHFVIRPLLSNILERRLGYSKESKTDQAAEEVKPLNDQSDRVEYRKKRENSKKVRTVRRSLLIEDNTYV